MTGNVTDTISELGQFFVATFIVGFVFYLLLLLLLVLAPQKYERLARIREMILLNSYTAIGLPLSAITSFALVLVFNLWFGNKAAGETTLKFFGLEFTGPSGPTTLWILCYLSIVISIRAVHGLRNDKQ